MKTPRMKVDRQSRIFHNAIKSIQSNQAVSKKDPTNCEKNKIQLEVKPITPLAQENMHNTLSSPESLNNNGLNENEHGYLNIDISKVATISQNSSLYERSLEDNNNLTFVKQSLHSNNTKELDFWIKESQLLSMQQSEYNNFEKFPGECHHALQNNQFSWEKNNNSASIQETTITNVNKETELWLKENRLRALLQLENNSLFQVTNECSTSFENYSPDLCVLVENSRLDSIQETLQMGVNNDFDSWIKENRLRALQEIGNQPGTHSSHDEFDFSDHKSVYVVPHSPENMASLPEENFAQSEAACQRNSQRIKNERLALSEHLKVQSALVKNFSSNCDLSNCSQFPNKMSDAANQNMEPPCENSTKFVNHSESEICHRREDTQFSDHCVKVSEPQNSVCKKIECISCDLLAEKQSKDKKIVAKIPNYDAPALLTLKSETGFFDSHCHLDFLFNRQGIQGTYADYMAQQKNSYPKSYKGCVAVFCKPLTFSKKFVWMKHLEQENVWAAFGCHPKEALEYNDKIEEDLKVALGHHKVKALGEIGLDYSKGNRCPKDVQQSVFRRQLKIAKEQKLRFVIHCRDADEDTIRIILEVFPKDTIFHLHCFTGDWRMAQKWIHEFPNIFIGITNLVTFPSALPTHEVARKLPLDHLLLETDAPYFVPRMAPKGTRYSHPGMAIHVAAQVAAFQNVPIDKVLQWTSSNTKIMYDIQ